MRAAQDSAVTHDDVLAAADRLQASPTRTPVVTSRLLDERVGACVFPKAESFQRSGAFKFRGAYNRDRLARLAARARGVAAYSSGNHAQAVALAASLFEIPAVILMPLDAPAGKVAATRGYGAESHVRPLPREPRAARRRARGRARPDADPALDHPEVIAARAPSRSSCSRTRRASACWSRPLAAAASSPALPRPRRPPTKLIGVFGVEPAAGDDVRRSLAEGSRVEIPVPKTIADRAPDHRARTAPARRSCPVSPRSRDGGGRAAGGGDAIPVRAAEARRRAERRGEHPRPSSQAPSTSPGAASA